MKKLLYCEFCISEKCRKHFYLKPNDERKTRDRNNGKLICLFCSRKLKGSGRNNPNCKYRDLDDSFLDVIDTEFKAYLLGWIASDGTLAKNNEISIGLHPKDAEILHVLKDEICPSLPVRPGRLVNLTLSSKRMHEAALGWLKIERGKKDRVVSFPDLKSDDLKWAFVRGVFDGDGSIRSRTATRRSPECVLSSYSQKMREGIVDFCKIPCRVSDTQIVWEGSNALDFMGKMYEKAGKFALNRKRHLYFDWCEWVPGLTGKGSRGRNLRCWWHKSDSRAVEPYKVRVSDSGFDLSLISIIKDFGKVVLYGTGIKIKPDFGWYFDLIPRSSLFKSGYMMANSIGVIDCSYLGEIVVPLLKYDENADDLVLPYRAVQLVPRPIAHMQMIRCEKFEATDRGEGGFGSTGKV